MSTRVNLGEHFYLWLSDTQSEVVVITTHGAMLNSMFQMPAGSSFKFYSLPTKVAYSGLDKTLYDDQVVEIKTYNQSQKASWNLIDDYTLSKFQGRHGNNAESYDDIRLFVDDNKLNVLSVRNRTSIFINKNERNTYLSTAVALLGAGYSWIKEFRCQFCRVEAEPAWRNALTGERLV